MQDNPLSFRKFKKIPLLFSTLFLIFSCSVFFFLYKKINDNIEISETVQGEWQIEASRRDEIKSLERGMKAIGEEITLLESHFAQSSDIVPFLDTIEELAVLSGGKAEVVSVDILKEKSELMIKIKASGNFGAVYKFLTLLENSPYELEFPSMHIKTAAERAISDEKNAVPLWEADFQIKLLSFIK
mgnify:CR=1 FL=1